MLLIVTGPVDGHVPEFYNPSDSSSWRWRRTNAPHRVGRLQSLWSYLNYEDTYVMALEKSQKRAGELNDPIHICAKAPDSNTVLHNSTRRRFLQEEMVTYSGFETSITSLSDAPLAFPTLYKLSTRTAASEQRTSQAVISQSVEKNCQAVRSEHPSSIRLVWCKGRMSLAEQLFKDRRRGMDCRPVIFGSTISVP
ncbi:hypothetical protein DPEC_G00253170 [Dallia pectoralis]|uniref:Uncharacterized protein n=1 Tax=Dallia pectoralis TaxID=75939 RepID=A0ACC2FTX0_DALPE|nr:hypothetical protein DPEC_G00253170 [Dallia pectoralis]